MQERSPREPIIKRRFTGLKMRKIMVGRELVWRAQSATRRIHLSHGALALGSLASRGLLAGSLSSMALKPLNSASGNAK
jgi:hypothetical protein